MLHYRKGRKSPVFHPRLMLRDYVSLSRLPTPPEEFHVDMSGVDCGMLGNDKVGDCVIAAMMHLTMIWNHVAGRKALFGDEQALRAYSLITGYDPQDPNTDQGTDPSLAAAYWHTNGIVDSAGGKHVIRAYLGIEKNDLEMIRAATTLFKGVLIGANVGDNQENQFDHDQPWAGVPGGDGGGHEIVFRGWSKSQDFVTSWARWDQPMDPNFYIRNGLGATVALSEEMLVNGKSVDGFDAEALLADLKLC